MMCDRGSGKYIATSAWEDRQATQASDQHVRPMREAMVERFGAGVREPEVREWEIAVLHREHAAGDGACCRITWIRTDPSRADQLLDMYRSSLIPRLQEMSGFCSLSMLIDRDSGRAVGTTVFRSRSALEQSRMLREESVKVMGVDILDVADMDLVFAHLRVPETV